MTRMQGHSYPAPTSEAVLALIRYSAAAAAYLKDPASSPSPDNSLLLAGLPQGPITEARVADEREGKPIAFVIGERNERFIEPEGFLLLRVLGLGGCGIHIDTNEHGREGYHYLEIGSETGLTFLRVLADAQLGEMVRQLGDHHDLTASNLIVGPGSIRNYRGRAHAMVEAFARFGENAPAWGLDQKISRRNYHALIRNAFGLYDLRVSGRFLRPIPEPTATREAA